jgi:hypothetical protein
MCFGAGFEGRLGSNAEVDVSGGGPALTSHVLISLSDDTIGIASLSAATAHTCLVRCDGSLICFGANGAGQLGINDSASKRGATTGDMATLPAIPFSGANIPATLPGCPARVTALTETTGRLQGFSSTRTLYLFMVSPDTASVTVSVTSTYPATGVTALVNSVSTSNTVALASSGLTKVFFKYDYFT